MAGIKSKVADVWVEFIQESSFHGIKYFIGKPTKINQIIRLIWLTIILAITGLLLYGLYDLYTLYRKFDFLTKSHIKYQTDFKFPNVYICSTMGFDSNKVNLSDKRSQYISEILGFQSIEYSADEWNDTFITDDFLNDIKFGVEDTIVAGNYNRHILRISYITTVYLKPLKPCFSFKPTDHLNKDYDMKYLLLILNLNKHRFAFPAIGTGVRISLSSDDIDGPGVIFKQYGAGLFYTVDVSPKVYNYLPSPYNSYQGLDCVPEPPDQSNSGVNSTREIYSYTACIRQCNTQYVIQKCGCVTENENKSNFRFCSVYERENCVFNVTTDNNNCIRNCKFSCTQTVYEQDISSIPYHSEQEEDRLLEIGQAKDRQQAKENLMRIYFTLTNKVEYIYHKPQVTNTQWQSTLGGFIGLYLGASILTFIELFFALIKTIFVVFREIVRICSKTKVENLEPERRSKTE